MYETIVEEVHTVYRQGTNLSVDVNSRDIPDISREEKLTITFDPDTKILLKEIADDSITVRASEAITIVT